MNETETRAELIDPALAAAGWGVVEGSRIRREFPITQGRILGQGRRAKALIADYVLFYKNQRLAVVEAKARGKYYTDGLGQAKDYAERLNIRFTYSTNGDKIYAVDMDKGSEGDVASYPTPEELWEMTFPSKQQSEEVKDWRERLFSIPFEDRGGTWQPRYYQENAITKVMEAIAARKERILLTLATGTGKTAISFQIAWKLFHARWNLNYDGQRLPRILFLADRNILADQAFNSFSAFDEDALVRIAPDEIRKKGKVPTNGSIFFTIFQTFMTRTRSAEGEVDEDGEEEEKIEYNFGEYPKDFFDLIIIDECHRGGANDESSWRDILEYFSPAVQLGLTATPKRDANVDTYDYFGEPVSIYSLKEGINDGFLTPFKVKEIDTTADTYRYTPGDQVTEGEVDAEKVYSEEEINRDIVIPDREEFRVKLFLDMINQDQKTLVFCATQTHAAMVRDFINQYSGSTNASYCCRVTADDGQMGEQHLRDFQDNEKRIPTVLTTSRKLSTGVDAPEIRNIVLMRPVKSMVEFKQIVGRGTRLFDSKDYFTVFDFVNAHDHFSDPEWDGEPLDPPEPRLKGEPKPCSNCGKMPCSCLFEPEPPCYTCGKSPCECDEPKKKVHVRLSKQRVLEIDSMVKTTFWSPDGAPISAEQFIQELFGDLPAYFSSEEELRTIWSKPDTRKKLLDELSDKGYSSTQLEDLQKLVHGQDSDLYDVLSYIAYHRDMVPRSDRAERAKVHFDSYDPAQQEFLNFVLEQYVKEGVNELDNEKLPDLLELKYDAIADAKTKLGSIASIRDSFVGFQEYLYGKDAV